MSHESGTGGIPAGNEYDWYQRACALLEGGNSAAAAILFQRLREVDANPSVLEALGRAQFDAKNYEEAVMVLEQLVEVSPDNDYAHFALGLSFWRLQKFIPARDHLAMAFVMKPSRSEYGTALTQVKSTLRHRVEKGMPLEGPIPGQVDL
ncbi:MAG: tetratricopeptide repeat protein [Candidatus Nanopelagicales bacterium]|jgi:tetratricopeptide (TPR) repeat protein|nr:tetratricopeptide repeat protein [Actinomycetes bacterium]MCH9737298.1 tetratricopeptide repeat protein [Actinomycetes bacterium]MCH9841218.1 tetratricopeptide repeat protein [Actinomycetes bacterium]